MYAGKERRNRVVALVLAVVLLATVVLALIATVSSASSARAFDRLPVRHGTGEFAAGPASSPPERRL